MAIYVKQGKMPTEQRQQLREVSSVVTEILNDVESKGDAAVREYSARFDKWQPESFRVSEKEIETCYTQVPERDKEVIAYAQSLIRKTAKAQLAALQPVQLETIPGAVVGIKHVPVASAANYAPGGKYPMVACAHMAPVVAKEAGVRRVIACAPPLAGTLPAHQIVAMHMAGVDEIYCMGGVHAIGAFAFGTESIRPVDLIVGPGNTYVTEAKRQVFGTVGIDMVAGPSEAMTIADDSADIHMIAVDLLGQAEHGLDSPTTLLTTSKDLAHGLQSAINAHLENLPTRDIAGKAWEIYGNIILCQDNAEMVQIANDMAYENVHVVTNDNDYFFERLENYGALFLGANTCVAFGDRIIGSTHPLPTAKAARYTGCLWAGTFLKANSYQQIYTPEAAQKLGQECVVFCEMEGFSGHAAQGQWRQEAQLQTLKKI